MNYFKINKGNIEKVRQYYDISEEQINEHVQCLQTWMSEQPHLPQGYIDDSLMERFLLRNKFNVEKTKRKIDAYFSYRGWYPELVEFEGVKPSEMPLTMAPLPKYTPEGDRITLVHVSTSDSTNYDFLQNLQYTVACTEIVGRYEYSIAEHYVLSLENVSFGYLKKVSLPLLRKIGKYYFEGFSARVGSIHLINSTRIISLLINFLKFALPSKIAGRITTHKTIDTVYEHIPRELFPSDFGGEEEEFKNLLEKFDAVVEEHKEMLNQRKNIVTNEELRPKSEKKYYFGFF